jgi:hypothetical protein
MFLTASFSSYSSNSETETFKVEKKTVIAIAEALNSGRAKSDDESARLGHILAHDKAVILFSQMIVDLCQNPSKYDFPVEGIDKAECTESQALERVKTDLAYTIGENFMGEVKADKVEDYLNNFLNTYLDKMKAVVEAFNSWM